MCYFVELKKTVVMGFFIFKSAKTHILQNAKIYVILGIQSKIDNKITHFVGEFRKD